MALTPLEKSVYVGAPWVFGVVLTLSGIVATYLKPAELSGILLITSGLVCTSLFCLCSLVSKGMGDKA